MIFFKLALLAFAVLLGIPSLIIDFKHRKRSGYLPGNEWDYYSKLSRSGSIEGKFMMYTTYLAIVFIVSVFIYVAFRLFNS